VSSSAWFGELPIQHAQLRLLHAPALRKPRTPSGASWHVWCSRHREANTMDDVSLSRALLSQNRGAPKAAWLRFRPVVQAIVVRRLGPNAEIDDISQEIFYRLFARIGTLQKPEALQQFVASFAIRVAKWERRRRRARRCIELTASGVVPERPVEDPLRFDFWDACRLCDKLRPRQRDVMFLRHLEGMTVSEIARALGLSVATIKRTLQAAQLRVARLRARRPEARVSTARCRA
jgi:RNA polymerase sigma-70 factor, ECF subfamily